MDGLACSSCTLVNPPGALLCEACNAYLEGCAPCITSSEDESFLVTARRLWDGFSDACIEGECRVGVAVSEGRIAWCGKLEELPEQLCSLAARCHHAEMDSTLIPGLIDSHVHIEFDPRYGLHDQPKLSKDELLAAMLGRARRMLAHGITTARDLGGKGGAIALRAAIQSHDEAEPSSASGPRLLCAGQAITKPKGHCWQWGGEASNEEEIREVARRQLRPPINADVIKIMATGGVRTAGTNPSEAAFTRSEIAACVEVANASGRPCAAHAHGVSGIGNAASAGVTTIEHCSWVDRGGSWGQDEASIIREIARRGMCIEEGVHTTLRAHTLRMRFHSLTDTAAACIGIFVCPTIGAGWATNGMASAMAPSLRRMVNAGVRLIAGSDAGAIPNLHHHRLADGLVVMARMGQLSHAEALRSATSEAAAALGVSEVCGSLRVGLSADLLVVHGNPILDLEVLCAPMLAVIARGRSVPPCGGGQSTAAAAAASRSPAWTWSRGRDERAAAAGGLGSSARCACVRS